MTQIVIDVEGMKCGGCESLIKAKLESIDGVHAANADHKSGQVQIQFDASLVQVDELKDIILTQGYSVRDPG